MGCCSTIAVQQPIQSESQNQAQGDNSPPTSLQHGEIYLFLWKQISFVSTQFLTPSLLCISPKLLRLTDLKQVSAAIGQEFAGGTRGIPGAQTPPSHPRCHLLQFISAVRELIRNILPLLHFECWLICQIPPCYHPADGLAQNMWGHKTQMGEENRALQHLECTCEPISPLYFCR